MKKIDASAARLESFYKGQTRAPKSWFSAFEWVFPDDGSLVLKDNKDGLAVGCIVKTDDDMYATSYELCTETDVPTYQHLVVKSQLDLAVETLYDYAKQKKAQAIILDDVDKHYEWAFDTKESATVRLRVDGSVQAEIRRFIQNDGTYYRVYWGKSEWCIVQVDRTSPCYDKLEAIFNVGGVPLPEALKVHWGLGSLCLHAIWYDHGGEGHLHLYDSRTGDCYGEVKPFKYIWGEVSYLCSCGGYSTTEDTLEKGKAFVIDSVVRSINSQRRVIANPEHVVEDVTMCLDPDYIRYFKSDLVIYQVGYKKWEIYDTKSGFLIGYIHYLVSNEQYQAGICLSSQEFSTYADAVKWLKEQLIYKVKTNLARESSCQQCSPFYLEESKKGSET
jgi:hypothetical protein